MGHIDMPTYEYECTRCGKQFEVQQAMTDAPLTHCPDCSGPVRRRVSGGAGFILRDSAPGQINQAQSSCSFEQTGQTCCGRTQRCEKPPCED